MSIDILENLRDMHKGRNKPSHFPPVSLDDALSAITYIGDALLETPCAIALRDARDKGEINKETILSYHGLVSHNFMPLIFLLENQKIRREEVKDYRDIHRNTKLALASLDHDYCSLAGISHMIDQMLCISPDKEILQNHSIDNSIVYGAQRKGVLHLALLASGNQKYTALTETKDLPELVDKLVKISTPCNYEGLDSVKYIRSEDSLAGFYYPIANAGEKFKGGQDDGLINKSLEPEINATLEKNGNYLIWTVSDNGPGIPEHALQNMHRGFTINGSGIGGQIILRTLRVRGGFAEVFTKEPGSEKGNYYSTHTNKIDISNRVKDHGTIIRTVTPYNNLPIEQLQYVNNLMP